MPSEAPTTADEWQRGDMVEWDWVPSGFGKIAMERNLRPLGRVITKDDLPFMSVREGPLNIQLVDDPAWVLSIQTMLSKGRVLRRSAETHG